MSLQHPVNNDILIHVTHGRFFLTNTRILDEGEKNDIENTAKRLKVEDRIVFAGLIHGNDKLETLKSDDLSLLNSLSQGLPTTLLKSVAIGLPIVCSAESNLPKVKISETGYVIQNEQ